MKRVRTRGVRKNMSWLVLGRRIMKLDKLHHTIQGVARGALRRGLKWQAYNVIEEDKYHHRQPYGQWLWIPKAHLIGHVSIAPPGSGGFIGHGDKPVPYAVDWHRAHPLARNLKEVWHAYQWGTFRKGKIHRYGGSLSVSPEFAHWLEAREVAEREGRAIEPFEKWRDEKSEAFHHAWWAEGRTSKGGQPRGNNGYGRPRQNAGRLYWPYGTVVKTTAAIRWHGLYIPKGTVGKVTRMLDGGDAAHVEFDDGRKYGSFSCFVRELAVVKKTRSVKDNGRDRGLSTPEMIAAIKRHSDKTGEALDVSLFYGGYRNPFRLGDDGGGKFWLMSYQDSTSEVISRATMLKRYAKARWFIKPAQTVAQNGAKRLSSSTVLAMKTLRRRLWGITNLAISTLVIGWDTVVDRTEKALKGSPLRGMFKGELREINGLWRRYKGHKMPVTTAISPARGALWKLDKALGKRR